MKELQYVSVPSGGKSYCYLPYYCSTNTIIVFENLYLPIQNRTGGGTTFFAEGPGRFQGSGNGMMCGVPNINDSPKYLTYEFCQSTYSIKLFQVKYLMTGAIDGKLEVGNAYLKIDDVTVATSTPYTGRNITLTEQFHLFDHWYKGWSNWIKEGHCGTVSFYENGTLAARFIPYEDDNGVAGFYDENNQTMIYSMVDPWVAGPEASSIIAEPSKSTLASTGETINIVVSCENAWTVTGETFLTLSSTGDTGSTTITATAPSYTGTTARTDTLTFTDTVTGDEWEITIKQKKYTSGQPFYLGADEIAEIYLGADSIAEAYLGEDLVFSSSPSPSPAPIGDKTLTISNMGTINGDVETKQITIDGNMSVSVENDGVQETFSPVSTAGYTSSYSNGTITISGPFGNTASLAFYYSTNTAPCLQTNQAETVTFVNNAASTAFDDSALYTNQECDCYQQGGTWEDGGCTYPEPPEDPCIADPCMCDPNPDECYCIQQGGTWDGSQCIMPE